MSILTRLREFRPTQAFRRRIAVAVTGAALVAFCITAQLVPSTSAGYISSIKNSRDTTATIAASKCANALAWDKSTSLFTWALNETTNSATAADSYSRALAKGIYRGNMSSNSTTPLTCSKDAGGAYVLNGSTSFVQSTIAQTDPETFSIEIWFKTTTNAGKLIGFGNADPTTNTGSTNYDRHLYIGTGGKIYFGIYSDGVKFINSPLAYTDGKWHQAVATFSASTGMSLYMDGVLVASDATVTSAQVYTGYWRVGYDNIYYWVNQGTNYYFNGSMRFAAVYTSVLSASEIANHYAASVR